MGSIARISDERFRVQPVGGDRVHLVSQRHSASGGEPARTLRRAAVSRDGDWMRELSWSGPTACRGAWQRTRRPETRYDHCEPRAPGAPYRRADLSELSSGCSYSALAARKAVHGFSPGHVLGQCLRTLRYSPSTGRIAGIGCARIWIRDAHEQVLPCRWRSPELPHLSQPA